MGAGAETGKRRHISERVHSSVRKSLSSKLCRGHQADKIPNGSFRLYNSCHFTPAREPIGEQIGQRLDALLQSGARGDEYSVAHQRLASDADEPRARSGNREDCRLNRILNRPPTLQRERGEVSLLSDLE